MRPTYAFLATHSNIWFHDVVASCPFYDCVTFSADTLGLSEAPNPFSLPLVERADVTLVDTRWFKWLQAWGDGTLDAVFRRLERASDAVVGVEAYDTFRLGAPPEMLDRCAGIVKAQGIYRDRALYNYDVGPYFPWRDWTGKTRPSRRRYSDAQLGRLHLSLPCFVGVDPAMRALFRSVRRDLSPFQARARSLAERVAAGFEGTLNRRRDIAASCFVGAASHLQRIEAVEALTGGSRPGRFGITGVPEYVFGAKERGTIALSAPERAALVKRLSDQGLMTPARPRLTMMRELRRVGTVVAPTGYGELTFRHAEAWRAGAALVCQDLSHAEIMYPLEDGVNVRYCRPDLSDLVATVESLAGDPAARRRVATAGEATWRSWTSDLNRLLQDGLMAPVAAAAAGRSSA
jgi:hypothetical protein